MYVHIAIICLYLFFFFIIKNELIFWSFTGNWSPDWCFFHQVPDNAFEKFPYWFCYRWQKSCPKLRPLSGMLKLTSLRFVTLIDLHILACIIHVFIFIFLQFPTLGFVVERYWEIQAHESEEFWTINCSHKSEEGTATFSWM